tara:strand:+ start:5065 stop:7422 length:2358 start_codon:yes stop_codon:yes gene_type:complete
MGSPRKRRLGKILDNLYGEGQRGGHEKNATMKDLMFDGARRKASTAYDKELTTILEDVEEIFGDKDDLLNIPEESGKQKSQFMQKASDSTSLSGTAYTKYHYYFYNNLAITSGSRAMTGPLGAILHTPSASFNFAMTATRSFASNGYGSTAEAVAARSHNVPVDPLSWPRPEQEGFGYSKALPASSWQSSSMWDILTQRRRGSGDWDLKGGGISPSGYTRAQADAIWPSGTLRGPSGLGGAIVSTKGHCAGPESITEGLRNNHATAGEWTGQGGWSISFWHYYADPANMVKSGSTKGSSDRPSDDRHLPPVASIQERILRPLQGEGGADHSMNPIMSFGSWMTGSGTGGGGPRQRRDGVSISVANFAAMSGTEGGVGHETNKINIPMYVFEIEDKWGCEGLGFGSEFPGITTRSGKLGGGKKDLGVIPESSPGNYSKRLTGKKMRAYGIDPRVLTGSSNSQITALKAAGRYHDSDRQFYGWNHVMMVWHGEVSGGTNAQGVDGWTHTAGNDKFVVKPNCEIYINGIQAGYATASQDTQPNLDNWTKQDNGTLSDISWLVYGTGTLSDAWKAQGARKRGRINSRVFTGSLNPHTAYSTPLFLNGFTNLCTGALHQTGSDGSSTGGMRHLNGNNGLCDVAIYNVPLTASDAAAIYNGGVPMNLTKNLTSRIPNLCAYWRMGNGVEELNAPFPGDNGFVIKDQSGFGHDMFLYGHTGSYPAAMHAGVQTGPGANRHRDNYKRGYYNQAPLAGVENRFTKPQDEVVGAAHVSSSQALFNPAKSGHKVIS